MGCARTHESQNDQKLRVCPTLRECAREGEEIQGSYPECGSSVEGLHGVHRC